jgi:hypothetical protein
MKMTKGNGCKMALSQRQENALSPKLKKWVQAMPPKWR